MSYRNSYRAVLKQWRSGSLEARMRVYIKKVSNLFKYITPMSYKARSKSVHA